MKKDFIPKTNSNLNSFQKNFLEKFRENSGWLEIRLKESEDVLNAIELNIGDYANMIARRAEARAATETYNASRRRAVSGLRRLSNRIKASVKYSRAIGAGMGIITPPMYKPDMAELKPVLNIKTNANNVVIKYRKNGADGITLYSRRQDEKIFQKLDIIFRTVYTDKSENADTLKPERREYYAEYHINGSTVGLRSDVVKVLKG